MDSSAVLAFLNQENGADYVERLIPDSKINAVNVAEVLTRSVELGHTNESARESFAMLSLEIIDFDEGHAVTAAELRAATVIWGYHSVTEVVWLARSCTMQLPSPRTGNGKTCRAVRWRSLDSNLNFAALEVIGYPQCL